MNERKKERKAKAGKKINIKERKNCKHKEIKETNKKKEKRKKE